MSDKNPSILSHVSIGTDDLDKAGAFYDKVMQTIGASRIEEINLPGAGLVAIAYGKMFPEFWLNLPFDQKPSQTANGSHFAFMAGNKDAVHAFWDAAIEAGAKPDGEPGERPHYGKPYYGCFMYDLDGHKIECMYWDAAAV